MTAVLLFTIVLTLAGMDNSFVTIQRPSTDSTSDKSLELTVNNGTFTDAFSQDLIGKSKMQIISPKGDGNYSVVIFFETTKDKDPSGLGRTFYFRSERPKSGDQPGNVIQLTENVAMATTFTAKVIRSAHQTTSEPQNVRGKVQLYILSDSDDGFYMAAKHPGVQIKNFPTLREVASRGFLNMYYRGIVAQIMEC